MHKVFGVLRNGVRFAAWFRGKQALGVAVAGIVEHIVLLPALDELSVFHHIDPIGDASHNVQIVSDEQKAHFFRRFQLGEQLEDLSLNGDVQSGRGFVGDKKVGIVRQRDGNHNALALAAGELVRVGLQPAFRVVDPGLGKQVDGARADLVALQLLMQRQTFPDLLLQSVERVQGRHGLLKDEADVIAPDSAKIGGVCADHFGVLVANGS